MGHDLRTNRIVPQGSAGGNLENIVISSSPRVSWRMLVDLRRMVEAAGRHEVWPERNRVLASVEEKCLLRGGAAGLEAADRFLPR